MQKGDYVKGKKIKKIELIYLDCKSTLGQKILDLGGVK
jgi:hypothetical protein